MVNRCGETKGQTDGEPYESTDQANNLTNTFVLYSSYPTLCAKYDMAIRNFLKPGMRAAGHVLY